ncbi:MAG: 3-deoxy-7-phosphoheptulonate synthase [Candidatus Binatia bacterium]
MAEKIENRNLVEIRALAPPREVKARLPLSERAAETVLRARREIRDLIHGRDRERLLVVVGPCSIHDPLAASDYAARLRRLAEETRDRLLIVMRTYFEKPRTVVGWKGLINDPHLDGSCDVAAGLELARRVLLELNELGLPCASELLDPVTPQYIADCLSWAAIGARTSASQTHREMASGLSMPVGFKNATDGGIEVAVHAMVAAGEPHTFLGIDAEGRASLVRTLGNPDRHIVLRGGGGRPNYEAHDVARAAALCSPAMAARPLMVDCSHDNSAKEPARQAPVCREVVRQYGAGQERILGILLESNLRPGNQKWARGAKLDYGVSITDACIGWEETEELLRETARTAAATVRAA